MERIYQFEAYTAIIADIIDSKKIKNRKQFQRKFQAILKEINKDYAENIASQFTIRSGDEFQALLKDRETLIEIISKIEFAIYPVQLRFGIGIGEIATDIDPKNSFLVDGTAYHRARAMLEQLVKNENQYAKRESNLMIASADSNHEIDQLMNAIFSLRYILKKQWTDRQHEVINSYLLNDENQYKTAESLGISQSSVSRALKAAHFTSYQLALEALHSFLVKKGES